MKTIDGDKHMEIGFIGFGLIGGSIAKGIKKVHPEYRLMAYSRTASKLAAALNDGCIDEVVTCVDEKLGGCDILIICTPVSCITDYLKKIKPYLSDKCIITDVGSTKEQIVEAIHALGLDSQFVGGHPMAGSEKTGYENADEEILKGAYYVLTPTDETPVESLEIMRNQVLELGSIPVVLDCKNHDKAVAGISHVPHLIACTLVNLVQDSPLESTMKTLAAGGFKDITRIASSSPEVWEQICMTNREAIAETLRDYISSLQETLADIENGNGEAISRLFERAGDYRNSIK